MGKTALGKMLTDESEGILGEKLQDMMAGVIGDEWDAVWYHLRKAVEDNEDGRVAIPVNLKCEITLTAGDGFTVDGFELKTERKVGFAHKSEAVLKYNPCQPELPDFAAEAA